MKIAISCTNPCHLFDLAKQLHAHEVLAQYYSGYPGWKLGVPQSFPLRARSWRTLVTYSLLRLPRQLAPTPAKLFRWQDTGFDKAVASILEPADLIHAMPGQCLETFRAAKKLGLITVLNHATAPVRQWLKIMRPEYMKHALDIEKITPYESSWISRLDAELALADYHCVASSVVRDQLEAEGIPAKKIMISPYGADDAIFNSHKATRPDSMRILFAGQFGIRKGIESLLEALTISNRPDWQLDVFGHVLPESDSIIKTYSGAPKITFHGPVSQQRLADEMRRATVLVLPSYEEAFGLVVPQAMACGLPCIVSSAVGAQDIINSRSTGSVFPVHNATALVTELHWWHQHSRVIAYDVGWRKIAAGFIAESYKLLDNQISAEYCQK